MRISNLSNNIGMNNLYLNQITREYNKSAQRISSGKKLNTDLVGSFGKLNNLKAHRTQVNVDIENLQSGYDFAAVKDGALSQITSLAQKIQETYGKNELDDADNAAISGYTAEIEDIIKNTTFNGKNVFSTDDLTFGSATLTKSSLIDSSSGDLKLDFSDKSKTDLAFNAILSETGTNAAQMNGIESRISINTTMKSNLDDAISRIEDVDITEENMKLAQYNTQQILTDSMIANMQSQQQSLINFLI